MLHNDEPAVDDTLQRESIVGAIASAALQSTPPIVLGVHGDWGLGKTSLLKQVENNLKISFWAGGNHLV
jgi:predicted KAP-like P-loop ATPase